MHKTTRKIILIICGIIILPLVFYVVFQVSRLSEEEQMIEEIYSKQLDAILFSINQYSNDLLNTFATQIELGVNYPQAYDVQEELLDKYVFPMILSIKNDSLKYHESYYSGAPFIRDTLEPKIVDLHRKNAQIIDRLMHYKKNNFTKLEPLGEIELGQQKYNSIAFVTKDEKNNILYNCTLLISPGAFIESLLGPRIQQVAAEEFVIQAKRADIKEAIYSTDSTKITSFQSKSLWLLSNYSLQIAPKDKSVKQIAKERAEANFYILIGLVILLILGFLLIFRNLNREVQLAQNKSDFVSSVSHEIRTPLALISMFGETLLLNRIPTEEKKREYYEIIVKESTRLRNIVNKILNFSQIEAGKKVYNFEEVDLTELSKEIVNTYSFHLQNKSFDYETRWTEKPQKISADSEAITEAIINLLDNAIKYSLDEKHITITTSFKGDCAFVEIADKGVGIEPKKKKQIFDKFYRITQGNIYNVQGAGLGLSLVKQIMDDHKGKIEIDSELDKGSCFRLLFPIISEKEEDHAEDTDR
ncbi:MAG: HAMP domain-containing sensor histidine kinase [Bacteroidota bacterium]